jgi:hypothetical protein
MGQVNFPDGRECHLYYRRESCSSNLRLDDTQGSIGSIVGSRLSLQIFGGSQSIVRRLLTR